jgi:hypothetical protein
VHQLVNKDFDSIKMHATTVKKRKTELSFKDFHFFCVAVKMLETIKFRGAVLQARPRWSEFLHFKRVGKITNRKIIMACKVPVITLYITKFNTHRIYILLTQCIYVFCMDIKTNSNYFSVQHWHVRKQ